MLIENHPFEPWLPSNAKLLMLGTFPPAEKRWCIPWYYPNFQNDMWRIFGIIYFDDKLHFVDQERKTYRLEAIQQFLLERGVAIYDTAQQVIRTKNTASDKDLQIVQPSDLDGMLRQLPECKAVLTAGQLATQVFTGHFGIKLGGKKSAKASEPSSSKVSVKTSDDSTTKVSSKASESSPSKVSAKASLEMGGYVEFPFEGRTLRLYRMPSSSRAYPMAVEKKAEYYRKMFEEIGL